jgi:hypothetical protein
METTIKSYEMFTKAGDKACQSLVNKMEKKIKGAKRITEDEINQLLEEGVKKIRAKHREVTDSEPTYHIRKQVEKFCEEVNYDYEIYI